MSRIRGSSWARNCVKIPEKVDMRSAAAEGMRGSVAVALRGLEKTETGATSVTCRLCQDLGPSLPELMLEELSCLCQGQAGSAAGQLQAVCEDEIYPRRRAVAQGEHQFYSLFNKQALLC